jgi:hypothetical protein
MDQPVTAASREPIKNAEHDGLIYLDLADEF